MEQAMTQNVELFGPPKNFAVVQMVGRNFPGVVVQGDTLHSLVKQLLEMQNLLKIGDLEELAGEIESMREELAEALCNYEIVCLERNIELPYSQKHNG